MEDLACSGTGRSPPPRRPAPAPARRARRRHASWAAREGRTPRARRRRARRESAAVRHREGMTADSRRPAAERQGGGAGHRVGRKTSPGAQPLPTGLGAKSPARKPTAAVKRLRTISGGTRGAAGLSTKTPYSSPQAVTSMTIENVATTTNHTLFRVAGSGCSISKQLGQLLRRQLRGKLLGECSTLVGAERLYECRDLCGARHRSSLLLLNAVCQTETPSRMTLAASVSPTRIRSSAQDPGDRPKRPCRRPGPGPTRSGSVPRGQGKEEGQ